MVSWGSHRLMQWSFSWIHVPQKWFFSLHECIKRSLRTWRYSVISLLHMCKKFRVPPTYLTLFPGSFPLLTHDFDLRIICSTDTYPVSAVPIRVYTKTVPRLWICTCFCVILQCQIISYLTSLHWSKQLFTNSKMKKGRGHSKSVPHRQICHIVSQFQFLLPTDSRHLILIFLLWLVGGWLRFESWSILATALV